MQIIKSKISRHVSTDWLICYFVSNIYRIHILISFWLDYNATQADLNLCYSLMSKDTFPCWRFKSFELQIAQNTLFPYISQKKCKYISFNIERTMPVQMKCKRTAVCEEFTEKSLCLIYPSVVFYFRN